MKNNIKLFKIIILIFFTHIFSANAENFVFESDSIEIKNEGNIILGKDGVKVITDDGLEINSDEVEYDKKKNFLKLSENVEILDKIKKMTIYSNYIEYDKKIEKISLIGSTKIEFENNYVLTGKNINYFRLDQKILSKELTLLKDKSENKLQTSGFIYSVKEKLFKTNNMELTDKDMNIYKTNDAMVDLNLDKIAAKDIQIYFAKGELGDSARLKGNSIISDKNSSIIKKGIFTTCKIRDDCPPWSLKSEEIKHDKKNKTINYKNSLLKLYDVPVFYFPKFFHPDPTVKRQSGFLTPSIINSSNNGSSLKVPYYQVISENKDLTVFPRFFFNNDLLLQTEYRQVEKSSEHITDFSIKKLDKVSKSHFFSNTKIDLGDESFFSDFEINFEKTSNDTYLKSNDIKKDTGEDINQSLMNSYLKYNAYNENFKFFAEIASFEDLSTEKDSDKFEYVFPNFIFSKLIDTNNDIKGSLDYTVSGSNIKKDTNVDEKLLINDLNYTSNPFFSTLGTISNFDLILKNAIKEGDKSDKYRDETQSESFGNLIFTSSLPLIKKTNTHISNLTPKLSARFSPVKSDDIKNLDRKISATNIFSKNRLGLTDSLEGGQSLTLGIDYDLKNINNTTLLGASLGQIYRDTNDNKLPITSKMNKKSSDIVGNISLFPSNEVFQLNYDFSADNNLDTMNYNKVETAFKVNNFITSFEFLEENNENGSDSYLLSDVSYAFTNNSRIAYNTRRNRKTNLTEFYNLIYEYKNDCLVAAIEYNKDYYQDRDLRPKEEIFFKLTITPFSSINSPNLNK